MRISKDVYAIRLAQTAALRSEDPHLKVGAVALTRDSRVVACAYNGLSPHMRPAAKFWNDRDAKSKFMLHAEMNLCALFKRGEVYGIACTHSPCLACARMMVAAGVRKVLFQIPYDREPEALEVLRFHHVTYRQVNP